MSNYRYGEGWSLFVGDCRVNMSMMADNSVDSVVCDPPYELGFMDKHWDGTGIAYDVDMWREVLRVLKPGGHILAFSGSRTYHRMTCAIEDAGFEIRDQIMWIYGSGFPKSLDVSKAIDKAAGAVRETVRTPMGATGNKYAKGLGDSRPWMENAAKIGYHESAGDTPVTAAAAAWQGWGTALKPAHEPICVGRKPLSEGTVAANVLLHGTGAINIDGCRVEGCDTTTRHNSSSSSSSYMTGKIGEIQPIQTEYITGSTLGRFPANLIHDGSVPFPDAKGQLATTGDRTQGDVYGTVTANGAGVSPRIDIDTSAARFFYCAKASKSDRSEGNNHPTVKPNTLMRYLVRLITPPNGTVFDPFTGSGSTGRAALQEGFNFIGCELSDEYAAIAEARICA